MGLGTDLTECSRIRGVWERQGSAFLNKVFTPVEQAYCLGKKDPVPYLAARFAAKEAVVKACGTGIGAELGWLSIGVAHDDRGAPRVVLTAQALVFIHTLGAQECLVSLTHTDTYAQAVALLIGRGGPTPL